MKNLIKVIVFFGFCLSLTSCSKFFGETSFEKKIEGHWKRSIDLAMPANGDAESPKIKLECDDEYFSNKAATHLCKFELNTKTRLPNSSDAVDLRIIGKMNMVGEWKNENTTVIETLTDSTGTNEQVEVNGQPVTDRTFLADAEGFLPPPYAKGDKWTTKTIAIEKDKWVVETEFYGRKTVISSTGKGSSIFGWLLGDKRLP
jgi:hypothetical protein